MKKIKNNLRNIALTSLFTLAGAFNYSGETIFNNNKDVSYSVVSSAPKDSLNIYKPLEIISKETVFPREFYLTPDSLNSAIRTAYDEMKNEGKRWPQEVDKRLFRLILRQESSYNVYAQSHADCIGLGQIAPVTYKTLRPKEWENLKDPLTGEIDNFALKKNIFNPVENIKLSLEALTFFSDYCKKAVPDWKNLDLDTKRRILLSCYNAGNERMRKENFDYESKNLKKETLEYHKDIMDAYYDSNVKVKL